MVIVGIIITAAIGLGTRIVWGYVVLKLAALGVKHPAHKEFLVELAKSKKTEIPALTLGRIGKIEGKDHDGDTDR